MYLHVWLSLKRLIFVVSLVLMIAVAFLVARRYSTNLTSVVRFISTHNYKEKAEKFHRQRNEVSRQLNLMKQAFGQQNCELLTALQVSRLSINPRVSKNGGWCKAASSSNSPDHLWDQLFSAGLSKFLEGKTVASFGDGPGKYKVHVDSLRQVKLYEAYDGAPYVENVTNGNVKFLDLTAPQYGLPAYDWVVSVEVGEHIPATFEDIYLDNLVRHAREGIVLSWAVPGQDGLSHVNLKSHEDVIHQMNIRGFAVDKTATERLKVAASFPWLRDNIYVYRRKVPTSFLEEDT